MKNLDFSQWLEASVSRAYTNKLCLPEVLEKEVEKSVEEEIIKKAPENMFIYTENSTFSQWLDFEAKEGRPQLVWSIAVEEWEKIKEKK